MGLFGTPVILAIAVVAGYYVYVGVFRDGQAPSCSEAQQDCMKACRRTSTDQASAAACQSECQRKRDACK